MSKWTSEQLELRAKRLAELSIAVAENRRNEFTMRVPAEPDRDADLVLQDAANIVRAYAATLDQPQSLLTGNTPEGKHYALHGTAESVGVLSDYIAELESHTGVGEGVSDEDRFEQYVATLIEKDPDIRDLGERLGRWLDDDQFNNIEPILLGIAARHARGVPDVPHECFVALREPTDEQVAETVYNINRKTDKPTITADAVRQVWSTMVWAIPVKEVKALLMARHARGVPDAYLHTVVQDDGEQDQALSFWPNSFPLQGVGGFRSIACQPLYLAQPTKDAGHE
ncbi:MAG: hypothetical protein KGI54_07250 [Pseudomonadota bacterium]|nr:hypothetical protein [Pseudomonadota bacterium]